MLKIPPRTPRSKSQFLCFSSCFGLERGGVHVERKSLFLLLVLPASFPFSGLFPSYHVGQAVPWHSLLFLMFFLNKHWLFRWLLFDPSLSNGKIEQHKWPLYTSLAGCLPDSYSMIFDIMNQSDFEDQSAAFSPDSPKNTAKNNSKKKTSGWPLSFLVYPEVFPPFCFEKILHRAFSGRKHWRMRWSWVATRRRSTRLPWRRRRGVMGSCWRRWRNETWDVSGLEKFSFSLSNRFFSFNVLSICFMLMYRR